MLSRRGGVNRWSGGCCRRLHLFRQRTPGRGRGGRECCAHTRKVDPDRLSARNHLLLHRLHSRRAELLVVSFALVQRRVGGEGGVEQEGLEAQLEVDGEVLLLGGLHGARDLLVAEVAEAERQKLKSMEGPGEGGVNARADGIADYLEGDRFECLGRCHFDGGGVLDLVDLCALF